MRRRVAGRTRTNQEQDSASILPGGEMAIIQTVAHPTTGAELRRPRHQPSRRRLRRWLSPIQPSPGTLARRMTSRTVLDRLCAQARLATASSPILQRYPLASGCSTAPPNPNVPERLFEKALITGHLESSRGPQDWRKAAANEVQDAFPNCQPVVYRLNIATALLLRRACPTTRLFWLDPRALDDATPLRPLALCIGRSLFKIHCHWFDHHVAQDAKHLW